MTFLRRICVACAVAAVAGCGGHRNDGDAIRRALAASPRTYLYYAGRVWWGRDVSLEIGYVRARDAWTVARIDVRPARPPFAHQWALLRRRGETWRVVRTVGRAVFLDCDAAPAGVVAGLVGGCASEPTDEFGLVTGPTEKRVATRAELRGVRAAARRAIFDGKGACVRYHVVVSRRDAAWAEAAYSYPKNPGTSCLVGNGVSVYVRRGGRWRHVADASDGFRCRLAPPGVIRSLDGACWTG